MTSLRRLTKEFEALEKNPLDYCEVAPADDKMSAEARLQGPPGTPYAAGVWTVDLTFPENYPFKAPTVKFRTEIKHPNVKTDTGEVCPEVSRGVRRFARRTPSTCYPRRRWRLGQLHAIDDARAGLLPELVADDERAPRPLERARGPQESSG